MKHSTPKAALRSIPPVDDLLGADAVESLRAAHPRFPWTHLVRRVVEEFRAGHHGPLPAGRGDAKKAIVEQVVCRARSLRTGGMRRVINGTGVILHTNLGRALLGQKVRAAISDAMDHYVNLELDLESGERSGRGERMLEMMCMATEAEAAMVVNNNAGAVYLVVSSVSPPGRVIVSRGELVEIGGSFRLPDILQRAASEVIEIGTTNRTYISDYEKFARPGDVFLRAHRSNYDIRGFTHETTIAELVALARRKECHVVYDLGSGSFFDFERAGIEGEEPVGDVLRSGIDCVTMSGDKLLGGVQAGIIVGRADFIRRLKQNPLRRALRIDKLTIAALQALLRVYLFESDPVGEVPVLHQATEDVAVLRSRAERLAAGLAPEARSAYRVSVHDDHAAIGGGTFAVKNVPSVALVISCGSEKEASTLARRMRGLPVPVLTRIKDKEVRLNFRTILESQDTDLQEAIAGLLSV
ncbi:MAG: L-seryl-tRNA(Sec) selenium transferase [Candidatus Krumholzibacteria bacterium]